MLTVLFFSSDQNKLTYAAPFHFPELYERVDLVYDRGIGVRSHHEFTIRCNLVIYIPKLSLINIHS